MLPKEITVPCLVDIFLHSQHSFPFNSFALISIFQDEILWLQRFPSML